MEKHFVIGPVDEDLVIEFFSETFTRLPWSATMEDVMVAANLFSKTQARKNGFSGPISEGISQVGPKKKGIWVWKDTMEHEHSTWWNHLMNQEMK